MKYIVPTHTSARRQTIGKVEFIVVSSFCGYETILQKLTRLMEDELDELPNLDDEKTLKIPEKTMDM